MRLDLWHEGDVNVDLDLIKVDKLGVRRRTGADEAILNIRLNADFRPAFSWNTKQLFVFVQAEYSTPTNHLNQVVLWDRIIQTKL